MLINLRIIPRMLLHMILSHSWFLCVWYFCSLLFHSLLSLFHFLSWAQLSSTSQDSALVLLSFFLTEGISFTLQVTSVTTYGLENTISLFILLNFTLLFRRMQQLAQRINTNGTQSWKLNMSNIIYLFYLFSSPY